MKKISDETNSEELNPVMNRKITFEQKKGTELVKEFQNELKCLIAGSMSKAPNPRKFTVDLKHIY